MNNHKNGHFNDGPPKVNAVLIIDHRSGKTSLLKVVFEKVSPHETYYFDTTSKIETKRKTFNSIFD